ncbi:DUF1993 domain-containing protein [Telmatospirillum sp.]|uniref:DUF1993 domain-containing protein n=1 Tax=Telmatospirillum sp. TaxID=2079197 RepID=UPI00284CDC6E|nr:DUF1993 domain-containing protein [Telmatospirillum sp.]MDR3438386.1 DUF1993 domain-containing protein [Telmatospirillum sp.]
MSLSMYQASVPVFLRGLANLSAILDKAAVYAEARKIDPAVLINARLAPDMFPLSRQVQIVSDVVKGGMARLAGVAIPAFADTETTFSELKDRIAKTRDFISGLKAAQIDGTEDKNIVHPMHSGDLCLPGQAYLLSFVLPNFFFHVTTAYGILRHNGLDVGKKDYLGGF